MHPGLRIPIADHSRKCFFVLIAAALFFAPSTGLYAAEPAGKAAAISGKVSVERDGGLLDLKPGDSVFLEDKLRTEANSTAEVLLLDESILKMAENSTLEVMEYLYDPGQKTRNALVSLISGRARFLVRELRDFREKRFRVKTATAIVGSRDTDFIVAFRDKDGAGMDGAWPGLMEVICLQDEVFVFSRQFADKPVLVAANMLAQVFGPYLPSPPRFASPAERMRFLKGIEQIGDVKTPLSGLPHRGMGEGDPLIRKFEEGGLPASPSGEPRRDDS